MRPRRGTELHGRAVFLLLVGLGVVAVVIAVARLFTGPPDALRLATSATFAVLGVFWAWRGGYMLEWWGPPEPGTGADR